MATSESQPPRPRDSKYTFSMKGGRRSRVDGGQSWSPDERALAASGVERTSQHRYTHTRTPSVATNNKQIQTEESCQHRKGSCQPASAYLHPADVVLYLVYGMREYSNIALGVLPGSVCACVSVHVGVATATGYRTHAYCHHPARPPFLSFCFLSCVCVPLPQLCSSAAPYSLFSTSFFWWKQKQRRNNK